MEFPTNGYYLDEMTSFDGPTIGKRVGDYRRLNGWTMEELAQRTFDEVKRDVIANIENGRKKDLTVDQLLSIAAALEVSPSALLFDIKKPGSPSEIHLRDSKDQIIPLTVWQATEWLGGNPLRHESAPKARQVTGDIWRIIQRATNLRQLMLDLVLQSQEAHRQKDLQRTGGRTWGASDQALLDSYDEASKRAFGEYRAVLEELQQMGIEFNG